MAMWNPWRGCHKFSEGCKFCYIHKGDSRRGVDTNQIVKTEQFDAPIAKTKKGEYKIKSGQIVYLCFSTDFLIEDADEWRSECWKMIKERSDLTFLFLTKRIERFSRCIPDDWNDGYDNVIVGCTVENQNTADFRLSIFDKLPIKHKNIICQPLIDRIDLSAYLKNVELVVVGGESDINARVLDYDWVLSIREQCISSSVNFEFRQCGTHFIKDGKLYNINVRQLCSQARKAGINVSSFIL
jgi:protein gp37